MIAVAIAWNFGGDYYLGKWVGFNLAFAVLIGWAVMDRFGKSAGLLVSYLLVSTCAVVDFNVYKQVRPTDLTGMKFFASASALKMLILLIPFIAFRIDRLEMRKWGHLGVLFFVCCSLVHVLLQWIFIGCSDVNSCGGTLGNPSLNSSMVACAMPFVFRVLRKRMAWTVWGVCLGSVMLSGSSIGMGMMVGAAILELLPWRRLESLRLTRGDLFRIVLLGASGVAILLAIGWATVGYRELFSSGNRFKMWEFFMSSWSLPRNIPFGMGFGTFGIFSRVLQDIYQMDPKAWWIWLHNDWLQMLFEGGLVGLGLMIATYIEAARKLFRESYLAELRALILFGIFMFFNYPLHVGLTCAFGLWLVSFALLREPGKTGRA